MKALPSSISKLTNLRVLGARVLPATNIPNWITNLSQLNEFYIEYNGNINFTQAPRGLTRLPCWENRAHPSKDMKYTIGDALRQLKLYDEETGGGVAHLDFDTRHRGSFSARSRSSSIADSECSLPATTSPSKKFVKARATYTATTPDHVSFNAGDIIQIIKKVSSELVMIMVNGSQGLAPLKYFEVFEAIEEEEREEFFMKPSAPPPDSVTFSSKEDDPIVGTYSDIMNVPLESFVMVGSGGFGNVYRVQLKAGVVAVKILKVPAKPGTKDYEILTREAKLMTKIRHENIVELFTFGCRRQQVLYVMEYADGGSLQTILDSQGALTVPLFFDYTGQILTGLHYLHSRNPPIEHRDLKPDNILICNGVAKIADFGLSTARETVLRSTNFAGTFHYAPPEAFDLKSYGVLSDMYTFGLVMWAMLAGQRPYDGKHPMEITKLKMEGKTPDLPSRTPLHVAVLMNSCWSLNYAARSTSAELLRRLGDIKNDPGPPITKRSKQVHDMDSHELIAYLRSKNVHPEFIKVAHDNSLSGQEFVSLDAQSLEVWPFNLSGFQLRAITRLVLESKSST
eukprot:TRINITY_DN6564_c0_g1_i10.p1 TRINITY_DN6564_c0_g1~~TRINITY_DN6564_c0_g1_i10.p1  ORF type:complete len:569 (-),score=97.37 TRINITY_DN6564_c0_g1_i10:257-1963(-)